MIQYTSIVTLEAHGGRLVPAMEHPHLNAEVLDGYKAESMCYGVPAGKWGTDIEEPVVEAVSSNACLVLAIWVME